MAAENNGTGSAPQRAVFVVGVGRSGTSAITRSLQALGVYLGDNLKSATNKNPTGFFEDQELLGIAKQVRRILGLGASSVSLIEERRWSDPELEALRDAAVETIRRRFGNAALWGFKYAQTLRMLPFWQGVFEDAVVDVSYVVALRTPTSVSRSRAKLDPIRGIQEKSDAEWLVGMVPFFRRLAQRPFVVVDFDLLIENPIPQLERIAARLAIPPQADTRSEIERYAESFIQGDMRHTRFDVQDLEKDERVNGIARDAYLWFRRLATDEVDPTSSELWEDWRRIEDQLTGMAPLLRHIDHLESEVRQAQGLMSVGLRWAISSFPHFWKRSSRS